MKSAIVSALLFATAKHVDSSGSSWNYEHTDLWSHTYSMCDNEDESPIDISSGDAVYDSSVCSAEFEWHVDYDHTTFQISNNGHSIVLKPVQATNIDPDHDLEGTLFDSNDTEYITLSLSENTIATLPNYFQPAHSEHDSFCLDSFHFHWGIGDDTGSEHLVDSHQYPLEVHFVHYSCHHDSLGTTLSQFPTEANVSHMESEGEDTHQLGVVGIFFDIIEGEHNPAFDAIFEQLENIERPPEGDSVGEAHIVTGLYLDDLIPEDIATAGYYAYEGSLTTPPCTNIVRWHVMKARSWIGADQMAMFRQLMTLHDEQIAPNYREPQHNVNPVYACMEAVDASDDKSLERTLVWCYAAFAVMAPCVLGGVCCWKNKKEKEQAARNQANK